jgi:hypothetical protein
MVRLLKILGTVWGSGSLRRRAESRVDDLLGRPNWLQGLWNEHPHRLTLGIAAALSVLGVVPWNGLLHQRFFAAKASSALSVITAAWTVEATLFALTAAITAILVNVGTSNRDRSRVIAEYRSRAFDAVAAFSLFTLLWTGRDLLALMDAEARNVDFSASVVSALVLMVTDIVGLGWLLVFSHHLLARTTSQIASEFSAELRRAFRQMGVREAANGIFQEWALPNGLQTQPYGGFPSYAHAVLATATGYVDDIRLRRLAKWLSSLGSRVGSSKAIISLGLDTFVSEGLQVAAIGQGDAARAVGLSRVIRWRTGTAYSFDSVLSDLVENTQAAARGGRPASFGAYVEILGAAFHDLFEIRALLAPIHASLSVALFGLAPEAQFRIQLRGLGYAVTKSDSPEIIGNWLYFVQEVLIRTRDQDRGQLAWIFGLWEQASVIDLPKEVDLWLRLDEYSRNLDIWLATSAHAPTFMRVAHEAFSFLVSLRNIVVSVPLGDASRVEQIVEGLGEQMIRAWPAGRPAANLVEQQQLEQSRTLNEFKMVFWLGWMGEICQRLSEGLSASEAVEPWRRNVERIQSFGDAISAWSRIALGDPFDWQREQSRRQRLQAQASGQSYTGGFVDPYAGTSIVLALLSLRLGIQPNDPQIGAAGLNEILDPYFSRILSDGFDRWGSFAGVASQEELDQRVASARVALREAGHHTAGQHERAVAAADVDPDKVHSAIQGFLTGVDEAGMRLVGRLSEADLVDWTDDAEALLLNRFQILYPKDSLLAHGAVQVVFQGVTPVAEREDAFLLGRLGPGAIHDVVGFDDAAQAIDDAIDELANLGTPASLVALPWNWRLATYLLERDGQDPNLVTPIGNTIGMYRGIALIRGLQWFDTNISWVIALNHIGRLRILRTTQPEGHGRFTAEIKPPNETELVRWTADDHPQSKFGFTYDGDDLQAVFANRWQVVIDERLTIINPNPAAVVRIRLVLAPHAPITSEPGPEGDRRRPSGRHRRRARNTLEPSSG